MTMIKKLLGALALSLTCTVAGAAGGGYALERAPDRMNDMAALQNGAKLFVNYCLNCHSANSMRYNKLTDIGLTEEDIKKNLLFSSDKVGDLMKIAMTPEMGKKWFGAAPPDLSVIARAKSTNLGPSGADYIYTYLRTFYRDVSRPTGWDNLVFPSVGMPHAMWERQGGVTLHRTTVAETAKDDGSKEWVKTTATYDPAGFSDVKKEVLADYTGHATDTVKLEPVNAKAAAKYDNDVADLANFMDWMAEPVQLERKKIGVGVILFLLLFFAVAWRLNSVFWKDIK
ncbi:cytochrome c1 [Alcaligenes faecalis]|uniref:cytochrome c1 n=1 Tax=Alcaligenes faecalis TaxID=511 RepID=UPI0029320F4E|nr:cytochrome c1 [Alcaligenes faecalis]MDV2116459.1 cytochrome c1 [Alcaligenes faecalis]